MSEFGAQLKQAREQRGISLRQIATATKISMGALEALERNDFSRLPGGIFSRAFVRAYAIEVGLDPDQTVEQFLEEYERHGEARADKAAPEVTADDRAFLERQRRAARWLRGISIAFVVLIVAAIVMWRVAASRSRSAGEVETPAPAAGPRPSAGSTLPPPETPATASAPQRTFPIGTTPAGAPAAIQGRESGAQTANGDSLRLHLEITSDCWVRVTVDGQVQIERVLRSSEVRDVPPGREVTLQVGNAGGVTWRINGRPAKSLGRAGQTASVRITRATLSEFVQ